LDRKIYTATSELSDSSFGPWIAIAGALGHPGAPIGVVSRSPDTIDIFVAQGDGHVWTATWEGKWAGWWRIGNLDVSLAAPIAAVSRSQDKIDIFVTARDGKIYTAAWELGRDMPHKYREWQWLAGGLVKPGAPVTAVCKSVDKLDVFAIGLDGRVWSAAWQPSDAGFRGWWPIGQLARTGWFTRF
jgi:hypothetical protein